MAKISLAGFKDPVRRPRYIIWTGVAVLVLAAVMIVALGVTSTRWFCSEGCHKVQDDTIIAYQHSTHANISCMACHMPVNANPIVFILHKAEALGELYMTVTNKFELPLNAESEVSLTMTPDKCNQCHVIENRKVTPSAGIKINHEAHSKVSAACPVCHNRVAHNEDFDLTLKNPGSGEPNKKHENFMSMTACFRCHGLEKGAPAPGACAACHPAGFELKPPSHHEAGFYPKGHAKLAAAEIERATEARKELGIEAVTGEKKAEFKATGEAEAGSNKSIGEELVPVAALTECYTCHAETFCTDCHGTAMPHSADFKEPKDPKDPNGHPVQSKKITKKCVMCHGNNDKTHFCDNCHHGSKVNWKYDGATPWLKQHPKAVAASGIDSCTKCHAVKFCVDCHTGRKVIPTSHKQATWLHPKSSTVTVYGKTPAAPTAIHATSAIKSIQSCEICHGSGGPNAAFCKGCHKADMPHAAEFKKNHVSAGKNPAPCRNCHTWKELCSNCHHIGSSFSKPWISLHGGAVNTNGTEGCLKCHGGESGTDKSFCVKCHQARKVLPASHKAAKFVRDPSSKMAQHVQLYQKSGEICTFCHTGDAAALPNSKFCNSCHKVEMPHKIDDANAQKFLHKDNLKSGKYKRAWCANCHDSNFCNACHHKESVPNKPWIRYHPNVVKKNGATPCFECHQETFCSNCHVNLAKRGLLH